jgi:hypothetical protein
MAVLTWTAVEIAIRAHCMSPLCLQFMSVPACTKDKVLAVPSHVKNIRRPTLFRSTVYLNVHLPSISPVERYQTQSTTSCQIITNTYNNDNDKDKDKHQTMAILEPYADDYYLWHYLPSIPAAVIFTLIFLGCTFGLSWRSWKARVKFCTPFIIGTFCKTEHPETLKCVLLAAAMLTNRNSRSHRVRRPSRRPQ